MAEIQRIVHGTDTRNQVKLIQRTKSLMSRYRSHICEEVERRGSTFVVPEPSALGGDLDLFKDWDLAGMNAIWGDFSEQNAIECVDFFVNVMIRSQQFSEQLPSVGGPVHVAVIRKSGFQFVSREEWTHGDYAVRQPEVHR